MIDAAKLKEQRKAPRRRVRLKAQIEIDQSSIIDCEIHNLSESGALIAICNAICNSEHLPEGFKLQISGDPIQRNARVIWRRAWSIGVSFDWSRPVSPFSSEA